MSRAALAASASPSSRAARWNCGRKRGAHDRPGDELREERMKATKSSRSARLDSAVHVDRVADRLERVERDADRQHDVGRRRTAQRGPRPSRGSTKKS